jgi:two-component system, NtrC family, response regulator AtoC
MSGRKCSVIGPWRAMRMASRENLMEDGKEKTPGGLLIGDSRAIQEVRQQIENAAAIEVPVLLTGESGTGKGVAARMLHDLGSRCRQRFINVNCPAIPNQLFESELFGYEPGAFTGANRIKPGKFEQANNGTLFLDEIGELELSLQAKLLQVLQESQFTRLGGVEEKKVNVRLIWGTNRNLSQEVDRGRFRADLFYRINVIQIVMPSLRERREDIPVLMDYYIQHYSNKFGQAPRPISSSLMYVLSTYHWPGNVRELENIAKRCVIFRGEEHVLPALRQETDSFTVQAEPVGINTPLRLQTQKAKRQLERQIILKVLQAHKWNRRKTAVSLDISYRALLYKIKEAGVPPIRKIRPRIATDASNTLKEEQGEP